MGWKWASDVRILASLRHLNSFCSSFYFKSTASLTWPSPARWMPLGSSHMCFISPLTYGVSFPRGKDSQYLMIFVSFSKEDVGFSPALATHPAPHFSSACELTRLRHSRLDITQHLGQFNRKPDLFTQFCLPCRACSSPGFPVLLWGEAPAPACPPWPQLCAKVGNEVQLDKVWPGESWRVSFLASWLNSSCEPRLLLWTKG